ncbi:MAG: acyl--CoA ligase [Clostridiales bacterium]|nr:acyl--CoA ligase [Clostridiales bacterium]
MELRDATIQQILHETADRFGDRHAVEFNGEYYSWRDLDRMSGLLADDFSSRGIGKGVHVGIWSPNNLAWILSFFAIVKLGAIAVLINSNYTIRELRDAIRIGKAEWLVYGHCPGMDVAPDVLDTIVQDCPALSGRMIDIWHGDSSIIRPLQQRGSTPQAGGAREEVYSDDVCCMIFTSGTTREPKCAMQTHGAIVNNAIIMSEVMHITEEDKFCLSLPLFHIFGLCGGFLACLHKGALVHVFEHVRSLDVMQCVDKYKCTIFNGVPTNYLALINNKDFGKYDMGSVRLGVLGGAAVTIPQMRRIQDAFPNTVFMTNYGQTEGACLSNTKYDDSFERVATTVGVPLPYVEIAIMDRETGQILPAGEQGEIVARGYSLMRGYFNAEPDVKPPIDEAGWLHTEDIGYLDHDGYIKISGRIKDVINRAGEQITAMEVEEALLAYSPISDVKVLSAPHSILGEQVIACLTVKDNEEYMESTLREILGQKLAPYKHPSYIFHFMEFPLSATGKLDQRSLREEVARRLAELGE